MSDVAPLLLRLPILERMRAIDGWLEDDEADLLIAGAACALTELSPPHALVEVGSFRGRATTVLASVARALDAHARVHAVDAHDGVIGALDQGIVRARPTLSAFRRNIARVGLADVVVEHVQTAREVAWEQPISFVLIDGLHDYPSVSGDFFHFEPWLRDGAWVAFHDYADYFPGVIAFVDELMGTDEYEVVRTAGTMVLARRSATMSAPQRTEASAPS